MQFQYPLGFWLGLAAAGVVAAHLVRRRAKRVVVPFLPLWSALLAQKRGGFGSALVRHLDLLLVLGACGAVALAAARPFWPGTPDHVRDLVLVLDGGVELRAGGREAKLRKVAAAEIRRRAPGTRMVVIGVVDLGASVWVGTQRALALRFVRAHGAGWLKARESEALALARAAARGLRDADLVLCTARPLRPAGFRMRHFGDDVKNAGIASLEVLVDPEGRGRLARLTLRGKGTVEVEGHWSGEVDGVRVVDVALPPAGRVTLTARTQDDGFVHDDRAYLILPRRKVPRVLVVAETDPSPFLAAALQALEKTGLIEGPLGRTTPAHAAAAARSYDVLLFDRCAPAERVRGGRSLYLAPPPGALPFKVGELTVSPALFDVVQDHPLLSGVDLERIPPRRARAVLGGESLAYAAPGPVLATGPGWVALGFDPDRSVLAASPAYPLFLRNCVAHLAQVLPKSRAEFYGVGEPAPHSGIAKIEGHGPARVERRLIGPPGFWRIGETDLAVSLLQKELDLRGPARESDALAPVGEAGLPDRPLTSSFAAAAILLLLLAWWVFVRS